MVITLDEAIFVVHAVWNGERGADSLFRQALAIVGLDAPRFFRLKSEARRVEGRFPRRCILTPTSVGKRR